MTVKLDVTKSDDAEFMRGLNELSGKSFTKNDFDDFIIRSEDNVSDTRVLLRSKKTSTVIHGEVERNYTRIQIEDILNKQNNDPRIHIWGLIPEDDKDNGYEKTILQIYYTLRDSYNLNIDQKNIKVTNVGEKLYAEVNNLTITGKAELYHVSDIEQVYLSIYVPSSMTNKLYLDPLVDIDQSLSSKDQLRIHLEKIINGNNDYVHLEGVEINMREPVSNVGGEWISKIEMIVPVNHPYHRPQTVKTEYQVMGLFRRTRAVFVDNGGDSSETVPFYFDKSLAEITSDDYDDIKAEMNKQFLLNLEPEIDIEIRSQDLVKSECVIDISENINFIFCDATWVKWLKPTESLETIFPDDRLDMYTGIK